MKKILFTKSVFESIADKGELLNRSNIQLVECPDGMAVVSATQRAKPDVVFPILQDGHDNIRGNTIN